MAFTKINAAGIGTTERVTVDGLTIINNLSVGGTVSIAGTLTYEDVTNVDSVGLITARSGINVSGGTATFASDVSIADKIIHTGDTDTAIRFPGTDIFTIETGGSERLRVDSAGLKIPDKLIHFGDTDTFLEFGTDTITLDTAGSERVRIHSSGFVGIGTDVPNSYDSGGRTLVLDQRGTLAGMTIRASQQGGIYFADGLSGNEAYRGRIEYKHADDSLDFGTSGTASKIRLDSSGRLLVDHTTAVGSGKLQVFTKTADALDILSFDDTAADGGRLTFYRNRNTAYGSNTKLAADDSLGRIDFRGMNTEGTDNYEIGASIRAECDSTPGSGSDASDMPGRLMFFTTPDGSDSPTERLRIDKDGTAILKNTTAAVTRSDFFGSLRPISQIASNWNAYHSLTRHDDSSYSGYLILAKNRNTAYNSNTVVQNNDEFGNISFQGNDGSTFREGARIRGAVDGTPGDNDMPGRITFWTTPDGSGSPLERMRISKDGHVTKPYTPFFSVYGTGSNQTYNEGDEIDFENVTHNTGSHFKMTSGTGQYKRFIAPVAGVYIFTFGFFPNSASNCRISLTVNGTVQTNPYISGCFTAWGTGVSVPMGSQMLKLSANDYVTVVVQIGTLTNTYDGHTGFQGYLLG